MMGRLQQVQLFGCQPGAFDASCDLLERDIARDIRRAMLRFQVDAEWRESTVVRGA